MQGYNRAMNLMLTEAEIDSIMQSVDTDGNGIIGYEEFIAATISKQTMLNKKNLQIAFNAFDTDKSGTITVEEVRKVLGGGVSGGDTIFEEIIKEVDMDGDNEIDINEF